MTTIRLATGDDRIRLGQMAGKLVRMHHAFDPKRFMAIENVDEGYGRWLASEAARERAFVIVAENDDGLVGYLYGAIEDMSYEALRAECGYVHDIWVEEEARRGGVAKLLMERACAIFKERGAPRVVLMAASANPNAQALFAKLGFRPTMMEMTRELE